MEIVDYKDLPEDSKNILSSIARITADNAYDKNLEDNLKDLNETIPLIEKDIDTILLKGEIPGYAYYELGYTTYQLRDAILKKLGRLPV